jgi:hypothetical protein
MTEMGSMRPVHPVAVGLAWTGIGEIAMPDVTGTFRQIDAFSLDGITGLLEEAELHP